MDFKQLEAYIKTVELSSFSKAAEDLFMSQPSVSNYINSLERELGAKLLLRSTKDIRPTKNGKVFYGYAKNIISLKEKAVFSIKSRTHSFCGEIDIHASSVPAQYILPELIIEFNKSYPDIAFNIIQSDTEKVIDSVLSQNCEAGFVGNNIGSSKCNYKFILSEQLFLIAPPDSLPRQNNLREYIYSTNFISREEGSATKYHGEELLKKLGIKPEKLKVVARLSDNQSIINAVSKGLGISIVSEIAAREYIKKSLISVIKLNEASPARSFYIATKKNAVLSPQVELFIKFSESYFLK